MGRYISICLLTFMASNLFFCFRFWIYRQGRSCGRRFYIWHSDCCASFFSEHAGLLFDGIDKKEKVKHAKKRLGRS
ncbi:hypothetical protein HMPREF3291_12040 [Bacillus sp. HMSC76G11]|nr:hypothetical protein HMPREF3291_12040 [Bacillus sp. HMSC76G11]